MFWGLLCLRFSELLEWWVMRFALSRTVSVQGQAAEKNNNSFLRDHSSSEETENKL